jgi:hypothetical protein
MKLSHKIATPRSCEAPWPAKSATTRAVPLLVFQNCEAGAHRYRCPFSRFNGRPFRPFVPAPSIPSDIYQLHSLPGAQRAIENTVEETP